ncbi:SPOR domain-containing protein [Methylophaga sulfidovorans]|uniref:Sporulation related domain-containing protein n=1 Tax=Methylophaga sulfidovorans TaxID=45496 RepID=A0A1I3WDH9_9GAMM|nr:SPOR domain-containing protein [Methylophaga sulfidovorans]SFK04476.1 Sporulation related domain-containing protein [Methylophaga sulfidovorans]
MAAKRNTRNDSSSRSLPWGPMLLSFAVGAFVMFLLHLKDNVPADTSGSVKTTESKQKQKPAKKEGVEPTFDFYTLLPEMEVMVDKKNKGSQPIVTSPSDDSDAAEATIGSDTQPSAEADVSYMLQVGSFKRASDADGFRAKLALLGIESKVQSVTIDNKETWHRVQVGPIAGRSKADALQKQLRDNNIDSLLLRAKHN